ncbi:hypothetical protein [Dyella sp. 2HG41-7]|uniref:hypothetical protein n=1 Tax=Dyella sp. 2HG41-7 TaxID=2883239 RepID=UPI001F189C9A|nr:hypothetical protein [Dyella sp. 2HG41-7]
MNDLAKVRSDIVARLLATKFEKVALTAHADGVSENIKKQIKGALNIADEIIRQAGEKDF